MKRFRLGNFLRGYVEVKAHTIPQAWKAGCKKFNKCFPTNARTGRMVYMDQLDETPVTLTTRYVTNQLKLPPKKQYFANIGEVIERGWITVAFGMSKQKLQIPKAKK